MADKFYRVALERHRGTLQLVNTFCIFGDDAFLDFTPLTAQGLADKLGSDVNFVPAWRGVMPTVETWDAVTVREMLPAGSLSIPESGAHAIGLAGLLASGDQLSPPELSLTVSLKTTAAIRSGHGYWAIPNRGNSTDCSGSAWNTSSTFWTGVQALVTEMGHWNTTGSRWGSGSNWGVGVYSRTRRAAGAPQFAFHVSSYVMRTPIRWRESRQA